MTIVLVYGWVFFFSNPRCKAASSFPGGVKIGLQGFSNARKKSPEKEALPPSDTHLVLAAGRRKVMVLLDAGKVCLHVSLSLIHMPPKLLP